LKVDKLQEELGFLFILFFKEKYRHVSAAYLQKKKRKRKKSSAGGL